MSLVVVGSGMVAGRLCELLARSGWPRQRPVIVLGEEPLPSYDRVHLGDLLESDKTVEELLLRPIEWYAREGIELHTGVSVAALDRAGGAVVTACGERIAYERLVLATGSRPLLPDVPGLDTPGVEVYRTARDCERIARRAGPGARVAILGSGLLGIELASALRHRGAEVCLLERAPRLLPRHLETAAAAILAKAVGQLDVEIRLGQELVALRGAACGIELELVGAPPLGADLVVVAAGIRPRDELAVAAGLECDRRGGVCVDDALTTSDPRISAIGECAVHRGVHYGLAAPGFAMAEVLARHLQGEAARFDGMPFSARLEIEGIEISMLGESESGDAGTRALTSVREDSYRRVLLRNGHLIGATAVGPWPGLPRIQQAIARREPIRASHRRRFEHSAELWRSTATRPLSEWPDGALVCSCTGVTCGALRRAHAAGLTSPSELARHTGASTVCGSCAPLVAELCGQSIPRAEASSRTLWIGSIGAALAAGALVALGPIPLADTVQLAVPWDAPWRSSFARQITGFSVLALVAASLALSARKRWPRISFGAYTSWRSTHALLGAGALLLVALHTGLHLGQSLNRALMLSFLALALLGAGAGLVTAIERRLAPATGLKLRRGWQLAHVLALSPFGVLLGFHVLKVYYF